MSLAPAAGFEPPRLTYALGLAEKWARHRGDGVTRGSGVFETGRVEPVLRVRHGAWPIYVRDLGKCLMVLGVLDVPDAVRARLRAASPAEQREFVDGLREVLLSCPRVGFGLAPAGASSPAELERVAIDATLQVAENDSASFNRFCDAVQEAETILLRVGDFLQRFVFAPSATASYSSSTPPPGEIYL